MDKNKSNTIYLGLIILFSVGIIVLISLIVMNNGEKMEESKRNSDVTLVRFTTNYGEFTAEIYVTESPITAGNFISLVEEGFYDGTRFHRVIDEFMIQGGDPQSRDPSLVNLWGSGGPGYTIEDEFIENLSNIVGTLSMANSGPNSGGSQFFINVADNTFLDFDKEPLSSKHPVFGKVIEGLDIIIEISQVQTGQADRPLEDVIIDSVVIVQ